MKNKLFKCLIGLLIIVVLISLLFQNSRKKVTNNSITLAEVAHTVFYAPLYVAIENDYFSKHNLNVNLILTSGADKVAAALLSNDVEIGLCGAEATLYVYNAGEKNYLQTFSQLTQKDGSFIVSRKKIENFKLEDLKNSLIIGGRAAGMPEMTLEYSLKKNGIDPKKDLNIDTSIAFSAMGGTFVGGYGDFVTLFEPTASMVEKEGYGYVVQSVGELGGVVPYTSFSARKDYIRNNKEVIKNFNMAIQEGLDFVHNHSEEEIAKTILPQFPDSSLSEITDAVKRYKNIEAWPNDIYFSEESFNHLQEIMIDYGELDKMVDYKDLFFTEK